MTDYYNDYGWWPSTTNEPCYEYWHDYVHPHTRKLVSTDLKDLHHLQLLLSVSSEVSSSTKIITKSKEVLLLWKDWFEQPIALEGIWASELLLWQQIIQNSNDTKMLWSFLIANNCCDQLSAVLFSDSL